MNESITLYNQQNGADKVYKVDLEAVDGGYVVTGWNGRRGAALKAQPKIAQPVVYAEAKKAFDALVKSKVKGGYQPGGDGATYVTAACGERSGISLQLLKPEPEAAVRRFLPDPSWAAQQKMDGERRPIEVRSDGVIGGNRKGLAVAMPKCLVDALSRLPVGTVLDAEQIGETLYVFDLLAYGGVDYRANGFMSRFTQAAFAVAEVDSPHVQLVRAVTDRWDKLEFYQALRDNRQEGIVFKQVDAPYHEGLSDSQIKVKFVESATVLVDSVHPSKRSVAVKVFTPDGTALPLGNVTIPANHAIPSVGEVVEVEYLYVVSSLYQPVYRGVRTDMTAEACTSAQLKYRAGLGEDDDVAADDPVLLKVA